MSQTSSPTRSPDPSRDIGNTPPPGAGAPGPGYNAPDQAWKIAALAIALVILAILLFFLLAGPTSEEAGAPDEAQEEYAEEEEVEEPARAPAPPAMADDPRPSATGPSSRGAEASSAPPPALPSLNVLSVGYSHLPALRVVALRIGGALPYFLHEGDTVGAIKILAILQDAVHISHNGKTYEIKVGKDGKPIGEPKLVR